jgi:hypothetical protein
MTDQHFVVNENVHAATRSVCAEKKIDIKDFVEQWMLTNPDVQEAYRRVAKL